MPTYPSYPSQPFTGKPPGVIAAGPSDLRASGGTAPYYQAQIDKRYTRQLAGTGIEVQDEQTDQGWAKNELDVYAEKDDVQGNGVFDPPGTEPNIYPDAGVFANRNGLPGYLARERMYQPSEVVDSTTGRPVVYVNGGAVSMDSAAQIAFIERNMYGAPKPVIERQEAYAPGFRSTWNVRQNPAPISTSGLGAAPWSGPKLLLATVAVGAAMGGLYAMLKKGKKGRR